MSYRGESTVDLTAMGQGSYSQAELRGKFDTVESSHTLTHTNGGEAFDDYKINFDFGSYLTPPESTSLSSAPTPNFSDYNFDETSSGYPDFDSYTPQPHPVEQQQPFFPNSAETLPGSLPPQPVRSQTHTAYLQSPHPKHGYTRNRSLSQGDIDYVAANNTQVPNPTFIRLQNPRSRSVTPDQTPRKRRTAQHNRTKSRTSNKLGYQTPIHTPTSVPYYVNGMVPTLIGDPFSPERTRNHRSATGQQWSAQKDFARDLAGSRAIFRHMVTQEEIQRSQKIIEIGAMVVRGRIDPAMQGNSNTMIEKLDEVELYLRAECLGCEDALKGCVTIREVLIEKTGVAAIIGEGSEAHNGSKINRTHQLPSSGAPMQEASGWYIEDNGGSVRDVRRLTQGNAESRLVDNI